MSGRARGAVVALLAALACAAAAGEGPRREPVLPGEVRELVAGVLSSGDHQERAFAIVDKRRARLHVFDGAGRLRGTSVVLLGQAMGDSSAPDVGENTQKGYVPPQQRTTPAGRFVAQPGRNLNGERVVWVDYDAAFAIHRLRPGASRAARDARLATATAADNRASWGCVVVPPGFYVEVVQKLLGRVPSVVYVLPERGAGAGWLAALRRNGPWPALDDPS